MGAMDTFPPSVSCKIRDAVEAWTNNPGGFPVAARAVLEAILKNHLRDHTAALVQLCGRVKDREVAASAEVIRVSGNRSAHGAASARPVDNALILANLAAVILGLPHAGSRGLLGAP